VTGEDRVVTVSEFGRRLCITQKRPYSASFRMAGDSAQLRNRISESAIASNPHRDKVGSRLTDCKLLHIPLLLMGLSLHSGVVQLEP